MCEYEYKHVYMCEYGTEYECYMYVLRYECYVYEYDYMCDYSCFQ